MTEDEIRRELNELADRVEDLENERDAIKNVPDAVAKLAGQVETLKDIVIQGFDPREKTIKTEDGEVHKASSWDVATKVAIGFILPILLALISGYFLLKSQIPQQPPR